MKPRKALRNWSKAWRVWWMRAQRRNKARQG